MGKTRKAIQWLSFAIRALDCHGRVNKRLAGAVVGGFEISILGRYVALSK
jgi:hypothetical protein